MVTPASAYIQQYSRRQYTVIVLEILVHWNNGDNILISKTLIFRNWKDRPRYLGIHKRTKAHVENENSYQAFLFTY